MELRVLEYFLAVTREQNISGAAQALHLSQPTLSRQLRELEDSLGKQLFIRGNRRITLTEEGMILRKRAQEIVELVHKTEDEIVLADDISEGDIYIGAGESDAIRILARSVNDLQKDYPGIRFHVSSGDTNDVLEHLDKGLYDFGLLFSSVDTSKYDYITIPQSDYYGILMRKDSALASKETIVPEDLWNQPLICNRNIFDGDVLTTWLKKNVSELNIKATYNLLFNASLMVEEGIGYALALDHIIRLPEDGNLTFRPFEPALEVNSYLIWKKYQILSKPAEKFLSRLEEQIKLSNQ